MELWEGASFTDDVTEIIIYNFNRCASDPSLNPYAVMYHTPTIDSSGNKYAPDVYISATSSSQGQLDVTAPGESADEYSAYLHPDKRYLWKFTNTNDAETTLSISGRIIYEENYRAGGR